jgi:hypothetical protein
VIIYVVCVIGRGGGETRLYPLVGPVVDGCVIDAVEAVLSREIVTGEGSPGADAVFGVVGDVGVIVAPETLLAHSHQMVAVYGLQVAAHLSHPTLHNNATSMGQ